MSGRLKAAMLPLVVSTPVIAALVALGSWQMHRLEWKLGLLDQIQAAADKSPMPFADSLPAYTIATASGRFQYELEARLGVEVRAGQLGARLLTPLVREDGPAILVERGWVPLQGDQPIDRPEGLVDVSGYIKPSEPRTWTTPRDDTEGRHFYAFDLPTIARQLGLDDAAQAGLVVLGSSGLPIRSLPIPARRLPEFENPHLGYALTWYGLAGTLVAVAVSLSLRRWFDRGAPNR